MSSAASLTTFVPSELFGSGQEMIVTEAEAGIVEYQGDFAGKSAVAIKVTFEGPDLKKPLEKAYTTGKGVVPSADGSKFEAAPGVKNAGISEDSNARYFLQEVLASGFPKSKLAGGNVKALIGARFQMATVPIKGRKPILAPATFHGFGEEAAGATPSSGASDAAKTAAAKVVAHLLAKHPDGISKVQLSQAAGQLSVVQEHAEKQGILTAILDDEWAGESSHPWSYADGKYTPIA